MTGNRSSRGTANKPANSDPTMSLTEFALKRSRLTLFAALAMMAAGLAAYLDFPAQEEPTLPVRAAAVAAYFPGQPTREMEQLIARPIEDRIRSMPELKTLTTRVRMGQVLMTVEVQDRYTDLAPIWQRLRARMADVAPSLPAGTAGPFVDDEYGRVAVASIALTAPELTPTELRREARRLRDGLFQLKGVQSVTFHGLPEEALYLETRGNNLQQAGLTLDRIAADLRSQNVVLAGGEVRLGTLAVPVNPTGDLRSLDELRRLPITLPGGKSVPLGALVNVSRGLVDPPSTLVTHNGRRAVVLAVAMNEGLNVITFGEALRAQVAQLATEFPAGAQAEFVTFQADVVATDLTKTKRTFYETLLIVMVVVVGFVGWRAGWIVGATVPLTMLGSLLVMQGFGITLNNVTLAALIISLGLLVDNGIVITEDVLRRLAAGEDRMAACIGAGRSLAIPLLTATLACIAAFLPLMLVDNAAGEYARSLSWVMTITLLASWVLSLMIVPLLAYHFAKVPAGHAAAASDAAYATPFYRCVRRIVEWVQAHRVPYVAAMIVLLALAGFAASRVPAAFLAESNRRQVQLFWELPAGTSSEVTARTAQQLSQWLQATAPRWHLHDEVTFIGDGGPRFVLAINPPDPVPHAGYTLLNFEPKGDLDAAVAGLQRELTRIFPGVRLRLAKFSFGSYEAGTLIYRLSGPELGTLRALAARYEAALREVPGTQYVRNDWEPDVLRASVVIDQVKARLAGVTTADVAQALQSTFGGEPISQFREEDRSLPILWRADAATRAQPENLAAILVPTATGTAIPLAAIARIEWLPEPALIQRRNLTRTISVIGRNPAMSADSLAERLEPVLAKIPLPAGYRMSIGGEIEDSNDANQGIARYLPLAGLLLAGVFVWQFNSIRKLVIITASVPFCFIGVTAAMWLLHGKFDFMATLGLLALAGIIVSNAVLLLERIEEERAEGKPPEEAVIMACLKRLRPILMTKLTCVLGLLPLYLFGGALWENLAVTIIGGLAVGTLITLGLVPALYRWLFIRTPAHPTPVSS